MAEHTREPWEATGGLVSAPPRKPKMRDNVGITFRRVCVSDPSCYMTESECEANARRIVAAVNACENIPTAALESGAVADLLAACKELLSLPGISSFAADLGLAAVKQAESAIRKATGDQ